jgi:Xaa-Pro aminopeptidase
MTTAIDLERAGSGFSLDRLLDARGRTREAVGRIAAQVEPGMPEEAAKARAREVLKEMGMRRGWHKLIVRCGPNTTKDFMERSDPGVVLGEHDIFFVDIGPICHGYEGDAGDTFVLGADPDHHRAQADVRAIWNAVRDRWFHDGSTGRELYDYADATARALGWRLNLDLCGHRLSDYPHVGYFDGSLAEVDTRPIPGRWVLEIAIVHPERPFGAFYEDLLLDDQSFPDAPPEAGPAA